MLSVWYRIRFGVFVTLLSLVLLYVRYGTDHITQNLALKGNDLMQKIIPTTPSKKILLLEVTDTDTPTMGAWPWSRRQLGQLVQRLRDAGASMIVFVDVFADPDLARTDAAFASAIQDNGVILARTMNSVPVHEIRQAATAVGFVDVTADADQIVRRMDLVDFQNDHVYYSLALETVRALVSGTRPSMHVTDQEHRVSIPGMEPWVLNNQSRWRIKYATEFPTLNATASDLSLAKNRIVIVGVSTTAVNNWVQTPVGPRRIQWVQAQYLESLLTRRSLVTPPWADLLEMLASVLIITSILRAARNNQPWACIPSYLGGILLIIFSSWMFFMMSNLVVDWVWPTVSSTCVFALTFQYQQARKRAGELWITRCFGDSVGSKVLKQLKQNPSAVKTTGELKELSVLYADLRGFAGLAQSYSGNAEGLVRLIHGYMDQVLPGITSTGGTVDKLIGDGIMAFWNAPLAVEQHAVQAVQTAIALLQQVQKMNQLLTPEEPPLCLDIGINTGAAVVGNTGGRGKFNYTVLGESARTACMLELLCKQYGVHILLGEHTATQVSAEFCVLELDTVISESGVANRIYTVMAETDHQQVQETHARMLDAMYSGRYEAAIKLCRELKHTGILTDYYQTTQSRIRAARCSQSDNPGA
jgi:adenylate cyclase